MKHVAAACMFTVVQDYMRTQAFSESAYKVFANCHRLEKKREVLEWLEYKIRGDVALKWKGKYGMDSHTVWYVVKCQEEYERLSVQYHGQVLLCDCTFTFHP